MQDAGLPLIFPRNAGSLFIFATRAAKVVQYSYPPGLRVQPVCTTAAVGTTCVVHTKWRILWQGSAVPKLQIGWLIFFLYEKQVSSLHCFSLHLALGIDFYGSKTEPCQEYEE